MERIIKGIWIPIEVWQDKSLSWNEKILLMEIDSFTSKGHDCHISNEYIADLLGVTERSASRLLYHLLESGLIRVVKFDGRKRYVESTISFQAELTQMSMQGRQSVPHTNNNEYINNNTLSNKETGRFKKPSIEEIRSYCLEKGSRVDPEQFFNFYESNGWMVGKNHMKDWRAAVRTWEKREKEVPQRKRETPHKESVLEHNLKVMDELFGTDLHKQAYGNNQGGDIDEQ